MNSPNFQANNQKKTCTNIISNNGMLMVYFVIMKFLLQVLHQISLLTNIYISYLIYYIIRSIKRLHYIVIRKKS